MGRALSSDGEKCRKSSKSSKLKTSKSSMIKKELPQFLSDQKLLIVSRKFKCMSEITIQAPKTPKKKAVLTMFYQINRTPLSLFSSYPKFGIALKFLKQENP